MKNRAERKAAKAERRQAWKSLSAGARWKRRGLRALKVLGVVVGIVVIAVAAVAINFQIRHATPAASHPAASDWEAQAAEQSGSGIAAYGALDGNGDDLYVSTQALGWGQTTEDYSGQEDFWDDRYDGTDVFAIMGAYCTNCHTSEELGLYRTDEDTARAKVQSMVDDFGCTQLTEAQIEALTEYYAEKP